MSIRNWNFVTWVTQRGWNSLKGERIYWPSERQSAFEVLCNTELLCHAISRVIQHGCHTVKWRGWQERGGWSVYTLEGYIPHRCRSDCIQRPSQLPASPRSTTQPSSLKLGYVRWCHRCQQVVGKHNYNALLHSPTTYLYKVTQVMDNSCLWSQAFT